MPVQTSQAIDIASHFEDSRGLPETDVLTVKGAREHNLKSVDLSLPKRKLIVITGVSGSGKSSLAIDTIFAEGQRRYVESLSAYARQFIGQMEKPKYDTIRGLSPTICIEQKSTGTNPRSTVGTITEIYDYLRVLYARIGQQYCHVCGEKVGQGDPQGMVDQVLTLPAKSRLLILAPLVEHRKGEHKELLQNLRREGFARVRIDGVVQTVENVQSLAKHKKHTIEVVIDRLQLQPKDPDGRRRVAEAVESALKWGRGQLIAQVVDGQALHMSSARTCCGVAYPELSPQLFSFNAPQGMCPECNGIGTRLTMDGGKIVPDHDLSIREGAVVPWRNYFLKPGGKNSSWGFQQLAAMAEQWGIDFDTPWKKMPLKKRKLILYGSNGAELVVNWNSAKIQGRFKTAYEGLIPTLLRRYQQTRSEHQKKYYARFMAAQACPTCQGRRLKPASLAVRVGDQSISDLTAMSVGAVHGWLQDLALTENQQLIAVELIKEIRTRLRFLINVGLDYLSLERRGPTLSGGEAQRIRLASQVGAELTGVLYVLDEPSIGLHPRDNHKLLETLTHLRDIGNTLLVIEHDRETMESADWLVDMGPGAGMLGGEVVAAGPPDTVRQNPHSLTGRYLDGQEQIPLPEQRRTPRRMGNRWVTIRKAAANNLSGFTVKIPLGLMTAVTGVSGAGKSTLINQILYPALARKLHNAALEVGRHGAVLGLTHLDKVININQKAIGRTPRSNPATYTKVWDFIREVFAQRAESRMRGYSKGRFSFNVKGGRCEACKGDGFIKVEMHFLADVYVPCETCHGRRFNETTLEVRYKEHSIADVLDLTVRQARKLFANYPKIRTILDTLLDVGLGYIKLGQPATTLSGGEAQRIKLARELAKRQTGRTLYILDEPTTGLHFQDIKMLLKVLQRLTDAGNTVVVIEHNLDVIKTADWLIDLGPEGGSAGGRLVAQGAPEKVARTAGSYTGRFLRSLLDAATAGAGAGDGMGGR